MQPEVCRREHEHAGHASLPASRAVPQRVVRRVEVNNVPPNATMTNDGPVWEGEPVQIAIRDATDASPDDVLAGFSYSYDLDGDGVFEIQDVPEPEVTITWLESGYHVVHGRITEFLGLVKRSLEGLFQGPVVEIIGGLRDDCSERATDISPREVGQLVGVQERSLAHQITKKQR